MAVNVYSPFKDQQPVVSPGLRAPIAVALGAIPGALSRYYLGQGLSHLAGTPTLPIGTLGVNLLGCFLLGLFLSLTKPGGLSAPTLDSWW